MSRYRDDQEAARHRLESLEEKLADRDAELEQHKNEIAERDREISRLARELRSAGTARILTPRRASGMRFMVAGAMSAVLVAGLLGFISVRRTTIIEPAVTFTELPHERDATDALKLKVWAGKASIDEVRALVGRCMQEGDEECVDRATGVLKNVEPTKPL